MTADEIKALVEQLLVAPYMTSAIRRQAADALTTLSDQLTAKTELATLLRASLRKVEGEVEGLRVDAQRLDFLIERQSLVAENQWSTQNAFHVGYHGYRDGCFKWNPFGPGANTPREAIDAARSQSEEKP